jgi:hypothetical protein
MYRRVSAAATLFALLSTCLIGSSRPAWAASTVTGELVFNITITVKSAIEKGPLPCVATAVVNDSGSGATITESASS